MLANLLLKPPVVQYSILHKRTAGSPLHRPTLNRVQHMHAKVATNFDLSRNVYRIHIRPGVISDEMNTAKKGGGFLRSEFTLSELEID